MQPRLKLIPIYAIVLVSGAAALAYQLAWTRMFTTGLGHEMPAVLAVVTAFFLGLALGAALLHRSISLSPRPQLWYAIMEWTIGLWAFASTWLIPAANRLALDWIGLDPAPVRHWLVTFSVPFLALLPATMSMGGTLPSVERWIARATSEQFSVGAIYAANGFGGVAGVLVSTALLFPSIGYASSVVLMGILNLVCGFAALVVGLIGRSGPVNPSSSQMSGRRVNEGPIAKDRDPGVAATLFFCGLLGIGFEVLGVRALSQVLEGTVYTFATILAVYLLGTTAGAALYQRRLRRQPFGPLKQWLLIGLACTCTVGVLFLGRGHVVFQSLRSQWGDSSPAVTLAEFLTAAAVFAFPTMLMGALFTHLSQRSCQNAGGIGRAIAWNTLGCAMAPAVFGAVLTPVLQLKWAFVLIVAGYGMMLWPRLLPMSGAGLATLCLAFLPHDRLQFVVTAPNARVLSSRDGVMDSVAVVEYPDGNRSLVVNARYTMGGTGSVIAERRHAQIPLLLHPDPRRALFLGLGTGITFGASSVHPNLEADGAELVPEVIEAMHYFAPFNSLDSRTTRQNIHVIDARRFVRCSDTSYDVIVADLFHPARDGAGTLYTLEHFQAIRRRLAIGGLFCQWLPLHQLDERMLKVIVRTFLEVFPETDAVLLRYNVDTPVVGLIGRSGSASYSSNWFELRVMDADLKAQLRSLAITDGMQLFGSWIAGPEMLRTFSRDAEVNTDDRPVVMFEAPRFHYLGRSPSYGRLTTLLDLPALDGDRWIEGAGPGNSDEYRDRFKRFISARNVYLRGLVMEVEGNMPGALDAYVESARLSPDFSTGHARCLTLAAQQSSANPKEARRLLERLIEVRPESPVARELLQRLAGR